MFYLDSDHKLSIDGKDYFLADFVSAMAQHEARFQMNAAGIFAAVRIMRAPLAIESADMSILRESVQNPTNGYPIKPAYIAEPFIRCILDAKEGQRTIAEHLAAEKAA